MAYNSIAENAVGYRDTTLGTSMLEGQQLLSFVRENSELPKDELMKLCGYSFQAADGKTRYKSSDFMSALLGAQGVVLKAPTSSGGQGRQLSYKTSVMKNGNTNVGAVYFKKAGAKPGDSYKVEISDKKIVLKPIK